MDQELFAAARYSKEEVRKLLDQGADLNYQDPDGNTALMGATRFGRPEIVKELLKRGADPNLQDNQGDTVLIKGSRIAHLEIVKKLLNRGADPNLQNNQGETALMIVTGSDNKRWKPLMRANRLNMVKELLKHGADPDLQNDRGRSALDLAKTKGHQNLVDLIERYKLKPTITDPNTGISNLAITAANGPLAQLKVMIDLNPPFDLNQQDRDGNTALIYAIISQKPEHVLFLLDRGANPNLANFTGGTPLAYAIALNDPELEQMLINAGAQ